MSTRYEIPNPKSISELLAFIFGDDIGVSVDDTGSIDEKHIATFSDPEDKLVAICACDRPFVAFSGAALSMIPAEVANEMINGSELTDAVKSNFYEVMNICSKLMMSDSSEHLRLREVIAPGQSGDAVATLGDVGTTHGFTITIPRYGKGTLNFLIS